MALRVTGMSPQGVARWAPLALERAGLSERAEVLARDLSPVERVQLALARAFAGEPALLLIDDPTRDLEPADV
jgi:ABC-type ATPase involved in cell division